jgi:hypothetical protein
MEFGALIVDGEVEFTEVTTRAKDVIDQRCADVIQMLRGADGPAMAKDIHERFGGAHALLIPAFSTLLALGLVRRYRRSRGERGGAGSPTPGITTDHSCNQMGRPLAPAGPSLCLRLALLEKSWKSGLSAEVRPPQTAKESLQTARHRYRDSNPGFRTENPAS